QPSDWPSAAEVRNYGARVRAELDEFFYRVPEQLLHVALEHRLMHAETLAYLFHNLPYDRKRGPVAASEGRAIANEIIEVRAGVAELGRARNDGFGWDNEFVMHRVDVPAFHISRSKISNGEYLEFVRAGAAAPHFWSCRNGRWMLRAMFGEIP